MRIAVVGASLSASLLFAAVVAALPSVSLAQRAAPPTEGGGLITFTSAAGDHQQLTVIEPETRTLAVYHIDLASGEVVLKSVRNIHYDLKMTEFNGTHPSPNDIRSMLPQR